jgi:hypothetical protein
MNCPSVFVGPSEITSLIASYTHHTTVYKLDTNSNFYHILFLKKKEKSKKPSSWK